MGVSQVADLRSMGLHSSWSPLHEEGLPVCPIHPMGSALAASCSFQQAAGKLGVVLWMVLNGNRRPHRHHLETFSSGTPTWKPYGCVFF